jgi:hypothetical protein
MEILIVENGEFVRYKRSGECNRCGECCCRHQITYKMTISHATSSSFVESDSDETSLDLSDFEGWSVFYSQGVWWWFKVTDIKDDPEHFCEKYDRESGLCTIWKDDMEFKPICRYWPFHPDDVKRFPNCGFKFERMDKS